MSLRVAADSPVRPANDWSSVATDIATALGAPDEAVEVTSIVRLPGGDYRVLAEISAPHVRPPTGGAV